MKFVNVSVKKAGGGYRKQRAMVLANGRYKFVKNVKHTGRSSATSNGKGKTVAKSKSKKKHRKSTAMTHTRTTRAAKRTHRRRRHGGSFAGVPVVPVALAAAGLAYLTGKSGPKQVQDLAAKIPGVKTFGPLAVTGLACLAADRFVKRNKWLRVAGVVGVAAAAMKIGEQGSSFKWVGDSDDIGDYDIADIGDDDVGDDDDDIGDIGDDED